MCFFLPGTSQVLLRKNSGWNLKNWGKTPWQTDGGNSNGKSCKSWVNDLSHCLYQEKTNDKYTSLLYQYQNILLLVLLLLLLWLLLLLLLLLFLLLLPLLLLTIQFVNMLCLIMYRIYFNICHIISRHVSYPVGVAHPPTKNPRLNRPMDVAFSSTVDATRHMLR